MKLSILALSIACITGSAIAGEPLGTFKGVKLTGFGEPTVCATDIDYNDKNDPDVVKKPNATVRVMFHGNRFVAAKEMAAAFEKKYPGQVVSYTAIPPVNTVKALTSRGTDAGSAGEFMPDVVMGSPQWGEMSFGSPNKVLLSHGKYSDVNGAILIARSNDDRVKGEDWKKIIADENLRLAIPGNQMKMHPLVGMNEAAFDEETFMSLRTSPRVGFTDTRHHRSMPQRIKTKCEDVGLQFLQSKKYWEKQAPGVFKFIEIPIPKKFQEQEESVVYTVSDSENKASAELFAKFMYSPEVTAILAEYSLLPLPASK